MNIFIVVAQRLLIDFDEPEKSIAENYTAWVIKIYPVGTLHSGAFKRFDDIVLNPSLKIVVPLCKQTLFR